MKPYENKNKTPFFRRLTQKNSFWMIVSLLLAIVFWTYVTTTEGVEVHKTITNIKIDFIGADAMREANDLIVTEQDSTYVNVTFSGVRRVMNKLTSSTVSATVDLTKVTSDGRYTVALDYRFPSGVNSDDVTIERTSAETINFYVDKLSTKTVEVEGSFNGTMAEGYLSDEILSFEPMVVKISGPKTVISKVDNAYVSINRTNVDKSISYSTTYTLRDSSGKEVDDSRINRDLDEVNVSMMVLATKQVPLDVTIVDGAGAFRGENTTIRIEPASVMLAGDASVIDSTTKINLGSINLASFATDYATTFTIVPPNDTENMTGITEAAVTVSITGLSTKTIAVPSDNISCINIPEGFNADIITKSLNVVIRAGEDILAGIDEKNVRAVADLSDIEKPSDGVYTPAVKVYIDGSPEAGIIGDYKIYVTLE